MNWGRFSGNVVRTQAVLYCISGWCLSCLQRCIVTWIRLKVVPDISISVFSFHRPAALEGLTSIAVVFIWTELSFSKEICH